MTNSEVERRIANAKKIYEIVTTHPESFDMAFWCENADIDLDRLKPEDEVINCGTTMCIAGWAAHLAGYTLVDGYDAVRGNEETTISNAAMGELYGTQEALDRLFGMTNEDALDALTAMSEGEECTWELLTAIEGDRLYSI